MNDQPATVSSSRTRVVDRSEYAKRVIIRWVLPATALLGLWQFVAYMAGGISLTDVAIAFMKLVQYGAEGRTLIEHSLVSLSRVVVGFGVAAATAMPLGILVGRYKAVDAVVGPVVEATRPIPPIAWIPLSIMMFRTNLAAAQIFIIWIGAFFPILINTVTGVKRTSPVHLDVARTFNATELQILQKIVVPSAAPEMLAGLRIGFGIGWMCLIAAEMIGGGLGLGYLTIIMEQLGRTGETISTLLTIGFFGFVFTYAFLRMERRLLRWRREVAV
ncbi:MAG: ABC transporter permease [Candidatus Thorarchaeota archaeon]